MGRFQSRAYGLMAINIASIGEKARQAVPLDRLLNNVGILVRSSNAMPSSDQTIATDDADGPDTALDAAAQQSDEKSAKRMQIMRQFDEDEPIPLRERMNAWWHGDTIGRRNASGASKDAEVRTPIDMSRWTEDRMTLVEILWGDGFLEPGGAASVRKLFMHVMPNSKQSVLDLTTGLGGSAMTLAQDQNLWMDALESDEILAAASHKTTIMAGLGDQVPVALLKLNAIDIARNKYNLIYSRERLFTIAEKIELLSAAAKGLRTGGNLVITDLVVTDAERMENQEFQNWVRSEPIMPQPWTMSLYAKTLSEHGLAVVTRQDFTKDYLTDIYAGWQKVTQALRKNQFNLELSDQLLAEGEVWRGRTGALEAGDIALCRIIARRS